jgi:lipopolysaccharide transport system ATP-binding protein
VLLVRDDRPDATHTVSPVRDSPRIAIVGTFDVENFGDLLFPLLTFRELGERLHRPDIRLYSYREKTDSWPYPVRSLSRLDSDIRELDLLVVGAGHLVRFDKNVAPGYNPPPGLHHPTGYWLMPTLLAELYGVPVAWNSLTVSPDTPEWASALLGLAVRSASYVSVRDRPSLRELNRVVEGANVELVPDIAFGVGRVLPDTPSDSYHRFLEATGLRPPFVAVQPSPHLVRHGRQIGGAVREASRQGCAVLELPISPVLGDQVGLLELGGPTVRPGCWPHPLLLAEIISRSEAVIARSLHLSVVALSCGVPVHRPRSAPDPKYEPLIGLPGVYLWEDGVDVADTMRRGLGRAEPDGGAGRRSEELGSHWDAIAALPGRSAKGASVAVELISTSTSCLEALAARSTEPPDPRASLGSRLRRLRRG